MWHASNGRRGRCHPRLLAGRELYTGLDALLKFGEMPDHTILANAFHFMKCGACGYEFQSAFSCAARAIGCSETCPRCSQIVATPSLFGDMSFEPFRDLPRSPVQTFNGCDGFIFNGHISALWKYTQTPLGPTVAMFHRNVDSLINDVRAAADSQTEATRSTIYGLVTLAMTSLERLVRDLYMFLISRAYDKAKIPNLARFDQWGSNYVSRFGTEFHDLFIDAGHFRALRFLSAYRNCIVHAAGIIDSQTLRIISDHPDLRLYRPGGPLPINLETVISLSDSVTQWGAMLIDRTGSKAGLTSN